ncbi:hypothetical protein QJQ45_015822, partial [Haematococcus lacustris]
LQIFLTCLVGYPSRGMPVHPPLQPYSPSKSLMQPPCQPASMEWDCGPEPHPEPEPAPEPAPEPEPEPEPELEPVTQPTPRRRSGRLATISPAAPSGPTLPLDCEDPVMLRQLKDFSQFFANPNIFEDPSNQALIAKMQELGSINLWGDNNTIGAHAMQLAVSMQQHFAIPRKPRGSDQLQGRVVRVDEHRTTRVSSAVNGQQPCEVELDKLSATRPAGWKPPAGQVDLRLLHPAWSQQRDQPRSKRTEAEQVAEPNQPTKAEQAAELRKGKAAKAKPAPQPGRWVDRDCSTALNMQRIGESRWRPLELCWWPHQGALSAKDKEYPGLGYKRVQDKPPKAQQEQQQQQQPVVAQ